MPKRKSLLQACSEGNVKLVQELLTKKQRINLRDNHNWTALHHAVKSRNIECVRLILKNTKIDVQAECNEGQTALMWACLDDQIPIEIIDELLNHDAELVEFVNNEFVSPLHSAISNNRLDIVISLVKYGANVNYQDLDGDTPLHLSAIHANHKIMEYLLYHTKCDTTICNYQDYNSLDLIINLQHNRAYIFPNEALQCFKHLIDFMYDTDDYPNNGVPELILSVQDTDFLNHIIEHFFTINNSQKYFLEILKQCNCYFPSLMSYFHDNVKSINDFDEVPQYSLFNFDFLVSIDNLIHFFELCYEILSKGLDLSLSRDNDELIDIINYVYQKYKKSEQIELFKFLNLFGIAADDIRDHILERHHLIDPKILNSILIILNTLSIRPAVPQSMNLLHHSYGVHMRWDLLVETFIPVFEKRWDILRKFLFEKKVNFVPSLKHLAVFTIREHIFSENSKKSNVLQINLVENMPMANVIKDLILFRINA